MIELESFATELDWGMVGMESNFMRLLTHRKENEKVFFVVFVPPYQVYARDFEQAMRFSFPAVFFCPSDDLPTACAWDVIMYSSNQGHPIARQRNRPTW